MKWLMQANTKGTKDPPSQSSKPTSYKLASWGPVLVFAILLVPLKQPELYISMKISWRNTLETDLR
jgi:hypothetical protein